MTQGTVIHSTLTMCADCGGMLNPIGWPVYWANSSPVCFDCFMKSRPSSLEGRRRAPPQWPAFDGDSGSQEYAETATLPPARRILKGFL